MVINVQDKHQWHLAHTDRALKTQQQVLPQKGIDGSATATRGDWKEGGLFPHWKRPNILHKETMKVTRQKLWNPLIKTPLSRRSACRHIWRVVARESGSPELLESPRTSPKFPELPQKFFADFPEVLSLWNLTAIQSFPESLPDFPGSFPQTSPEVPRTSPEVSQFLWEAWHPLLTHKNFLCSALKHCRIVAQRVFEETWTQSSKKSKKQKAKGRSFASLDGQNRTETRKSKKTRKRSTGSLPIKCIKVSSDTHGPWSYWPRHQWVQSERGCPQSPTSGCCHCSGWVWQRLGTGRRCASLACSWLALLSQG